MEPLDDHELKQLASTWKAPAAPEPLHRRVFGAPRRPSGAWLFTGAIRIPVPVCAAIVLLLGWLAFDGQQDATPVSVPASNVETVTLADFQPPAEIQIKVVGVLP